MPQTIFISFNNEREIHYNYQILNYISCYHFEDMCCTLPYRDSNHFPVSIGCDKNYFYVIKHQRIHSAVRSHSITRQEQSEDHKKLNAGSPLHFRLLVQIIQHHTLNYHEKYDCAVDSYIRTISLLHETHVLQQSNC